MAAETGGSSPDRPGWLVRQDRAPHQATPGLSGDLHFCPLARTKRAATREGGRSFA